jgi:hypothetical protein
MEDTGNSNFVVIVVFWVVTPCSFVSGYQYPPARLCHNPANDDLNNQRCENLRTYGPLIFCFLTDLSLFIFSHF